MVEQAVILAGGQGTRLRPLLGDRPKPMLEIGGAPLLEHEITLARGHGIRQFLILTAYQPQYIIDYFGDGSKWQVSISYRQEQTPLGTAGALIDAWDCLEEHFLILYGDTMLNVDLERFWNHHRDHRADLTLFLHPNDHPDDSDLVETDDLGWVKRFHPCPHSSDTWLPNLVNAALYIVNRETLNPWRGSGMTADLGKQLFPQLLERGARIKGYISPEYIKDVGTPQRAAEVEENLRSGRIARGSLAHPKPAVFLDRDGTLAQEVNWMTSPDQLVLIDGAAQAVKRINGAELYTILITNQPVIARGDCSLQELRQIHNKLETLLGREGSYLNGIYFCPHHPDKGFPGERAEYKIQCRCRKPDTGMIEQAVGNFNLDLGHSWLIGDSTTDMETARRAGITSILVRTGHRGQDGKYPAPADYEFFDLAEAAAFITDWHPRLLELCQNWAQHIKPGDKILIGGLARSGKSVLAATLRRSLAGAGRETNAVTLDRWIIDQASRQPDFTVRQRFDYPAIARFWNEAVRVPNTTVKLPHYDKYSGEVTPDSIDFTYHPEQVLIVDGVPALDIQELLTDSALSIYVEVDERIRKKRFLREYCQRGRTPEQAEALYASRCHEEIPVIAEGKQRATVIWEDSQ